MKLIEEIKEFLICNEAIFVTQIAEDDAFIKFRLKKVLFHKDNVQVKSLKNLNDNEKMNLGV